MTTQVLDSEGNQYLAEVERFLDDLDTRAKQRRAPLRFVMEHPKTFVGLGFIAVVMGLWQLCSDLGVVNPVFASSPSAVVRAGWSYVTSAAFGSDMASSGLSFIVGLALGLLVGIGLGLLMGWFRPVEYLLDYAVSGAYAAPRIALVPLLIVWFGIGLRTEVAMVFLMVVFPMIINTMAGVHSVDRTYIELARSLNCRRMQLFRTIVLPAAVPYILAGVRVAIGTALIGVVVAEFIASTRGLGYMMAQAANDFQTARVFVGLIIVSAVGLILTQIVHRIERRFDRWRVTL